MLLDRLWCVVCIVLKYCMYTVQCSVKCSDMGPHFTLTKDQPGRAGVYMYVEHVRQILYSIVIKPKNDNGKLMYY